MSWIVEWGDKAETLEKMSARGDVPRALQTKPIPTSHASTFLAAFNLLTSSRNMSSAGVGPIPVSEVLAYASLMNIDELEERAELLYYLQVCDDAYLKALKRKQPKDGAGKHTSSRGRLPGRR